MSLFTQEQLIATNKANAEALLNLGNATFAGLEKLAALNINIARNALEESVENTKALLNIRDVHELANLHSGWTQPTIEKAVAYSRNVYEIVSETQNEISNLVEGQIAEINKNIVSILDKAAKSAPAGSDIAVAAVKSAIAAANSAYDTMSKAARQVSEIAEANVAAATNATVKAVNANKKKAAAA